MDVDEIVQKLKQKYPGKNVVITDPANPTEIVCEVEPGVKNSVAVAVIDKTRLHYHKKLTEVYEVIKGELIMYLDGVKHIVREGGKIEMKPGVRHYAVGKETWINVYSTPGWKSEDHILVFEKEEISRKKFDKK